MAVGRDKVVVGRWPAAPWLKPACASRGQQQLCRPQPGMWRPPAERTQGFLVGWTTGRDARCEQAVGDAAIGGRRDGREAGLHKVRKGGRVLFYSHSDYSHSDVHSSFEGCPPTKKSQGRSYQVSVVPSTLEKVCFGMLTEALSPDRSPQSGASHRWCGWQRWGRRPGWHSRRCRLPQSCW